MSAAELSLPPETSSVPAARRFVRATLLAWGLPAAAETAEILVSEVCTNVVLHARTDMTVEVSRLGDVVRICVRDGAPTSPRQRRHSVDSTTGRGMHLIEVLSQDWGVDRLGGKGGKVVWVEVPVDAPASAVTEDDADVDVEVLLAAFSDAGSDAVPPMAPPAQRSWALAAA